ncbi:MAG TPA: EthD family reductase [Acidimicrobiales bacterium]|nr:EthD family reductase [Acidimicrobiales bacterium]
MMKLVALWTEPADPDGFDADYLQTHAALCQALPGLVSFSSGRCVSGPFWRTADLAFESGETMGAALGGEEGAALLADTERLQTTFGNTLETLVVTTDG